MRQLVLEAPRELRWHEVPDPPPPGQGEAHLRPLAVALCDLDPLIIEGLWPLEYPLALGHEFVGQVVAVGDGVEVRPGDVCAVPFQISCGGCEFCRRGLTANCELTPHRASYGFGSVNGNFGGAIADLVEVPHANHMLVPLPEGVRPAAAASVGDNMADSYGMVAPGLELWPGADVLVVGGAAVSTGLYAAGVAVALGAGRVVYVDTDPDRLGCARALGAEPLDSQPPRRVEGDFRVTVDASGTAAGLECAVRSTGPSGFCSCPAGLVHRRVELPVAAMYDRCCTFSTGRVQARPAMEPLLDLIASGRFHPELVSARTASFAEAEQVLLDPGRKLVLEAE